MNPTHPITLLLILLTLPLQAQNPCVSQSVLDAKKRIVQQLKANQTTCTWNFALYKEKKVGDKTGLYTHTEKEILPPEFKDILGPPYSWFVLAKKMGADKYSLYNMAGSQLAESAYYSVLRIPNSACAVEAIDETDAVCRDDSYTFSLNYLCSYYLARIDNGKQGLFNSDYETLLPFEFSKIIHAGGSRFITSTGGWPATFDLVDVETQQALLKDAESIQVSFVDQAKRIYMGSSTYQDRDPLYTVKKNGKSQLLNTDLTAVLPKTYDEISLKDSFVIVRDDQLYELYTSNGDLLVPSTPESITDVINGPKGFAYVTKEIQNNIHYSTLCDRNGAEILSWENGDVITNRTEIYGYARIVVNEIPKKNTLAFISFDGTKGIFVFEDFSYEIVEREE